MWGWSSCEIVRASRSNRLRKSGSAASLDDRIFTATVRSSRVSLGFVDLAHPAGTDQRHDFVRAESGASSEGHVCGELEDYSCLVLSQYTRR